MDELVDMPTKRAALADVLTSQALSAFGEDFALIERPLSIQLNMKNRLDRLDIIQNDQGQTRLMEVYWFGPEDAETVEGTTGAGSLKVEGNRQFGQPDRFRVVLHYGYDEDGSTYQPFEALLTQQGPDRGLLRLIAEEPAVETDAGEVFYISTPQNVSVPPVPRPLTGSGDERAHYAEFAVICTDQG